MSVPLHQRLQLTLSKTSYLSNSHIQDDLLCQYTRHDTCKHEMYVSDHGDLTFLPNRMNVPFFLLCVSHMALFCHTCCGVGTSSSLWKRKTRTDLSYHSNPEYNLVPRSSLTRSPVTENERTWKRGCL